MKSTGFSQTIYLTQAKKKCSLTGPRIIAISRIMWHDEKIKRKGSAQQQALSQLQNPLIKPFLMIACLVRIWLAIFETQIFYVPGAPYPGFFDNF
jgi:hypothetical protein